jgi:hypothetical protein
MTVKGKQMFDALNFSNWNFKKRYVLHIQLLEAGSQTVTTLSIHYCLLLLCLIILGKFKRKEIKYNKLNQPTNQHTSKKCQYHTIASNPKICMMSVKCIHAQTRHSYKRTAAYNRFKPLLGCSQPELKWLNNSDYLNVPNT